ncbi:hypothetical protein BC629DRAFT_77987 [Irpex lacteus]|nr:hypothetical protein BC629DRAFT_77987 [Irpex lacteus]
MYLPRLKSSESESPVLVQPVDTAQPATGSPLSSRSASTASTSYHSAARVPSPSRAVSRLSLYTAYRHPTGNSPAPESSSVASPGSAHSLLFTLSQSMKGKRTESPNSAASASAEQSPEMPPRFSFAPASPRQPSTPALSDKGVPNPRVIHVGADAGVSASATTVSLTRTEESTVTYREDASTTQSQARTTVTAPGEYSLTLCRSS